MASCCTLRLNRLNALSKDSPGLTSTLANYYHAPHWKFSDNSGIYTLSGLKCQAIRRLQGRLSFASAV